MFEIEISSNNSYVTERTDVSGSELQVIKSVLKRAQFGDKVVRAAHPFLQGQSGSWVLIEFWTDDFDAVDAFVNILNKELEAAG